MTDTHSTAKPVRSKPSKPYLDFPREAPPIRPRLGNGMAHLCAPQDGNPTSLPFVAGNRCGPPRSFGTSSGAKEPSGCRLDVPHALRQLLRKGNDRKEREHLAKQIDVLGAGRVEERGHAVRH